MVIVCSVIICTSVLKPLLVYANETTRTLITISESEGYDLDGDGQTDEVKITGKCEDDQVLQFTIYINGKKVLETKMDWPAGVYDAKIIKMKDGNQFLFLHSFGDSAVISMCKIFQYDGRKLNTVMDFKRYFVLSPRITFNNSNFDCQANECDLVGNMWLSFKGTYKNGKFRLDGTKGKTTTTEKRTLTKKVTLYANTKCTKKLAVIPANTEVTIKEVSFDSKRVVRAIKVKYRNKSGWIKVSKKSSSDSFDYPVFSDAYTYG